MFTVRHALCVRFQDLDTFNNSGEAVPLATGPAQPQQCQASRDNGILAPCGLPNTCNP